MSNVVGIDFSRSVDHPSSFLYRKSLNDLISSWEVVTSERRREAIDRLASLLSHCAPGAYASMTVVTLHTVAVLLTRDAANTPLKSCWSNHPRYSEPLLLSLLQLLYRCLTPHLVLPPPAQSSFPALFGVSAPAESDDDVFGDKMDGIHHFWKVEDDDSDGNEKEQNSGHSNLYLPYRDILRTVVLKSSSESFQLSLAYLFAQLNAMLTDERANELRLSALSVIVALADVIDAPLLAAFLPALASTLTSTLSRTPRLHSSLARANLRALQVLSRVFPCADVSSSSLTLSSHDDSTNNPSTLEQALRTLSLARDVSTRDTDKSKTSASPDVHPPSAEAFSESVRKRKSLRIQIDDAWRSVTAKQLQPRLVSVAISATGPRVHSQPSVRIALIRLLLWLLSSRNVPLRSEDVAVFKYVLLEACADPYQQVASAARQALHRFPVQEIEQALAACVSDEDKDNDSERTSNISPVLKRDLFAIRLLQSTSDDRLRVRLCTGMIVTLFPREGAKDKHLNFIIEPKRLPALVARVGVVSFAKMLVYLHQAHWRPSRVAPEAVTFSMNNVILRVSQAIGRAGLLSSTLETLIAGAESPDITPANSLKHLGNEGPERNVSKFKRYAHAAIILQAVLSGALDAAELEEDLNFVDAAGIEILGMMSRLFIPSVEQASDEEESVIDDEVVSMKMALLQGLSNTISNISQMRQRTKRRPVGSDIVLVVLVHVLQDAAHGEKVIRPVAMETLHSVATIVHAGSVRGLLMRHVNYVMARVIRNLGQPWAADVLKMVVGTKADDLSQEVLLLLLRTLRGMSDTLAGINDHRASETLGCMRSILLTALAQLNETPDQPASKEETKAGVSSRKKENIDANEGVMLVRRVMLKYCLDDVKEEDIVPEPEFKTDKDKLFDGLGENEDEVDEEESINSVDSIAESVLDGTRDLLVGRSWGIRAAALECATLAVRLLKQRKKVLLPHVAKLLPLLPVQFDILREELDAGERLSKMVLERRRQRGNVTAEMQLVVNMVNSKGAELPVVRHACLLLSEMTVHAGIFVKDRFVRMVFPKLRPLLRLCEWFPTLLVMGDTQPNVTYDLVPSYGAMAACDACLQMLASIATHVPTALVPFTTQLVKTVSVFFGDMDPDGKLNRSVNVAKREFEKLRWNERRLAAEQIVTGLSVASPDLTFCTLLANDPRAPSKISPCSSSGTETESIPIR